MQQFQHLIEGLEEDVLEIRDLIDFELQVSEVILSICGRGTAMVSCVYISIAERFAK